MGFLLKDGGGGVLNGEVVSGMGPQENVLRHTPVSTCFVSRLALAFEA